MYDTSNLIDKDLLITLLSIILFLKIDVILRINEKQLQSLYNLFVISAFYENGKVNLRTFICRTSSNYVNLINVIERIRQLHFLGPYTDMIDVDWFDLKYMLYLRSNIEFPLVSIEQLQINFFTKKNIHPRVSIEEKSGAKKVNIVNTFKLYGFICSKIAVCNNIRLFQNKITFTTLKSFYTTIRLIIKNFLAENILRVGRSSSCRVDHIKENLCQRGSGKLFSCRGTRHGSLRMQNRLCWQSMCMLESRICLLINLTHCANIVIQCRS